MSRPKVAGTFHVPSASGKFIDDCGERHMECAYYYEFRRERLNHNIATSVNLGYQDIRKTTEQPVWDRVDVRFEVRFRSVHYPVRKPRASSERIGYRIEGVRLMVLS